jgi:hypothetical protein
MLKWPEFYPFASPVRFLSLLIMQQRNSDFLPQHGDFPQIGIGLIANKRIETTSNGYVGASPEKKILHST